MKKIISAILILVLLLSVCGCNKSDTPSDNIPTDNVIKEDNVIDDTYKDIDKLAQLRIEDLMLKSINAGKYENVYDFESETHEKKCTAGSLSTWISKKLDLLGNKEAIINLLFKKLDRGYSEQEFVFTYFTSAITKKPSHCSR